MRWSETPRPYLIATLEKAVLDTLYISTRRSRRFARLPELDLQNTAFNVREYRALIKKMSLPPQIAAAMQARFEALSA